MVVEHLSLVWYHAKTILRRLPPHSAELDDLIAAGSLGLISAAERFDPSHGVLFRTFAQHRIRGAIRDYLREADYMPRDLRKLGWGVSSVEDLSRRQQSAFRVPLEDVEARLAHRELTEIATQAVEQVLKTRSPKVRAAFEGLYRDNLPLEEAAARAGVSPTYACNTHQEVIVAVQQLLKIKLPS